MNKNILIVSYTFPPSKGIGGRRWSKFSKYLKKKGYTIFLITKELEEGDAQNFKYEGINKVVFLKSSYPSILNKIPTSFIEKVRYKIALKRLQYTTKGNYYDRGIFLKNEFIGKATELIDAEGIDTVVISGAPFHLLYYGALLKQIKSIKLISDIRDPWTWGKGYGMTLLHPKRKEIENYYESEVVKNSDLITVPVAPMEDHLKSKYTDSMHKIKLIPHAFDEDDFVQLKLDKPTNNKYKLIYGGTIYAGLEEEFEKLFSVLKSLNENEVELDVYTRDIKYYSKEQLQVLNGRLNVRSYIPSSDLMKKIHEADAYLLIFPDEVKDFITTKFYEIIYCKTPIIFIGAKGKVSEFIESNKLGIHIEPANLAIELSTIIKNKGIVDLNYNFDFEVEKYSFDSITDSLIKMVDEIAEVN